MRRAVLRTWVNENTLILGVGGCLSLLLFKFLWPLFSFDLPLGYDAGIYRFLFLRYSEVLPLFDVPELPPWAREHPPGLFLFSTLFLRLGVPVDWLLGWIWNLFPVLLAGVCSWIIAKKWGRGVGMVTLFLFALAPAYYDGFAAMYWKTFAALLWMVLAFASLERRQWLFGTLFAFLTLVTHHQTGLLFTLAVATWFFLCGVASWSHGEFSSRRFLAFFVGIAAFLGLVAFAYGELFDDIVWRLFPLFFQGSRAPAGSFPPPHFYLAHAWPLLLLGIIGFLASLRRERWTLWQLTLLWSFLFIALRLMFYRRFMLQFEFFLVPFAAVAVITLWQRWSSLFLRGSIVLLLLLQAISSVQVMAQRVPAVSAEVFAAVQSLSTSIPDSALVLTLEPTSTPFLRGWLSHHRVGGPGIFDSSWSEEQWERFLLGTLRERHVLLQSLPGPVFLFASPEFSSLYGADAERFLADPCLRMVSGRPFLLEVDPRCLAV